MKFVAQVEYIKYFPPRNMNKMKVLFFMNYDTIFCELLEKLMAREAVKVKSPVVNKEQRQRHLSSISAAH